MSEYTPTTYEVRELWGTWGFPGRTTYRQMVARQAEFDRWLADHDAEVAAKALEDTAEHFTDAFTGPAFRRVLVERAAALRVSTGGENHG